MFAVIRHPDVTVPGIVAAGAVEVMRANGWIRVSDYRPEPADFHLPEFVDAVDDLDAEPEPEPEPERKTRTAKTVKAKTSKEGSDE
jgi:hypothetical protein